MYSISRVMNMLHSQAYYGIQLYVRVVRRVYCL